MKINLWYSKSMSQWRWTLSEEFKNGVTKLEQHSGQQPFLRDAMEDVANTVEYMLESKKHNWFHREKSLESTCPKSKNCCPP